MTIPSYPLGNSSLRVHDLRSYIARAGDAAHSSHRHDFWQLISFDGSGDHFVDLKRHHYQQHSLLVLPDGAIHRFETHADGQLLHFPASVFCRTAQDTARLLQLRARSLDTPFFTPSKSDANKIRYILTWLQEEIARETQSLALQHSLLQSLTLLILRGSRESQPNRQEFLRFLELVEARYTEHPSIPDLARTLQIPVKRLYAITRAAVGLPPGRVLENRLILEAQRQLVHSSEPVSSIGFALGFDDPAYFSRFFKKQVNQSPSQFRLTHQRNTST